VRLPQSIVPVLLALGLAPAAAGAQADQRPAVSFGVLAGGSLPAGRMSRLLLDPGYHLGGLAELRLPTPWLALRVDAAYQHLDMGRQTIADANGPRDGAIDVGMRVVTGTTSAVLRLPALRGPVQPYALAGVGMSRVQTYWQVGGTDVLPSGKDEARWRGNASAGVGLDARLGRTVVFAEARYQRPAPGLRLLPLSVGGRTR
jgi:hypothetical protein